MLFAKLGGFSQGALCQQSVSRDQSALRHTGTLL